MDQRFGPLPWCFAAGLCGLVALGASEAPQARPDSARARQLAEAGNDPAGFDMAPETRLEVVQAAVEAIPVKLPAGPFKPTWESLENQYRVPSWFDEAKLGIFIHWGIYSVPAYHNEWYEQHMYDRFIAWHTDHFGPIDRFGYKDFIPMFTAAQWDPAGWAELFRKAGAKYVIPTAQHHDNFANWDSAVTPWNAKRMGPRRDPHGVRTCRHAGVGVKSRLIGRESQCMLRGTPTETGLVD